MSARGRMSQKGIIMVFFSSNTDRILYEHPWLWAVKSSWAPNHTLEVLRATVSTLGVAIGGEARWWMYIQDGGFYQVVELKVEPGERVACAVVCNRPTGQQLQALASHSRPESLLDSRVTVWRGVRRESLLDVCQRISSLS